MEPLLLGWSEYYTQRSVCVNEFCFSVLLPTRCNHSEIVLCLAWNFCYLWGKELAATINPPFLTFLFFPSANWKDAETEEPVENAKSTSYWTTIPVPPLIDITPAARKRITVTAGICTMNAAPDPLPSLIGWGWCNLTPIFVFRRGAILPVNKRMTYAQIQC